MITFLFRLAVIYLICITKHNEAARILAYFPVPSISHQVVFRALTLELAQRGHELVILTTDPAFQPGTAPANYSEIDLHEDSYREWRNRVVNNKDMQRTGGAIIQVEQMLHALMDIVDIQLSSQNVQNILKSKQKFDLVLTEACIRPSAALSYAFNAPLVQVSSLGAMPQNIDAVGADNHPIFYPQLVRKRFHNLSLLEKVEAIYEEMLYKYILWNLESKENAVLSKHFGPRAPNVRDLDNKVDLLLLNIHSLWDNNRAVPPNVVHVGGLHQKQEKPLPQELKSYLDESKHGVIYMSFGTNVDPTLLPAERIRIFTNVFSKLPYDVLWKWNGENMTGKPDNVRISKWLPQSDLLRHPNIKLFITQAGLQSTDEAITAGVPLIAFPMLGDQWYNAEQYVLFGIGRKLNIETITEHSLSEAIKNVVQDESYRNNIKKLRNVYNDNPQTSMERAVWWTEYVIRHKGAPHLRSAAANISWSEYLILDVVTLFTVIFLVLLGLSIYIGRLVMSCLTSNPKLKKC